jgi:hypothetical protein
VTRPLGFKSSRPDKRRSPRRSKWSPGVFAFWVLARDEGHAGSRLCPRAVPARPSSAVFSFVSRTRFWPQGNCPTGCWTVVSSSGIACATAHLHLKLALGSDVLPIGDRLPVGVREARPRQQSRPRRRCRSRLGRHRLRGRQDPLAETARRRERMIDPSFLQLTNQPGERRERRVGVALASLCENVLDAADVTQQRQWRSPRPPSTRWTARPRALRGARASRRRRAHGN